MDLKRMGRISGFVAAVAMLAMVLQGCGSDGDGGSGISQDMYDSLQADYDAAVADRDAAMAAQMAAMEAQTMAETERDTATAAQMAAMEAQAAAEARRDVAVAAQAVATAAAAAAETAKMDAEDAEAIAVAAQTMAEDERDAARLDVVAAEAAQAIAEAAKTAADAARDAAVTAQMAAEDAQEVAEDAAAAAMAAEMTAKAAEMTAKADLKVAQAAEMAAKAAQATAEAAEMTAKADLKAAQADQKKAEDDLATAIMERDDALAMLNMQDDAGNAQRARVDAAAIKASAGHMTVLVPGIDINNDGEFDPDGIPGERLPVYGSSTNTVEMFQGSGAIPGDADPTMPSRNGGEMTLTATRVGNTVSFEATADADPTDATPGDVLIDFDAVADADGMTRGMTEVDLPGGQTKHINLMSDIMAPAGGLFANAVPDGLADEADATGVSDAQEYRYLIAYNWVVPDTGAARPTTDTEAAGRTVTGGTLNLDRNTAINIDLGTLAPTAATPTVTVGDGAKLSGSYAGVAGAFRCNAPTDDANCSLAENADGEVLAGGMWQFVPASATVFLADTDYLIYGAWLKKPDTQVGVGASAAISAGSMLFDADDDDTENGIANLTGKATYTGHATGFFAERHVDSGTATSGKFSATAELTANFDAGTDSDAGDTGLDGTLSGMITDFDRDDDVEVDWVVSLRMLDLGASTTDADPPVPTRIVGATNTTSDSINPGGFTAGATGGSASGAPWSGEWGVQFVGPAPRIGTETTSDQHPNGVVGTFGAQRGMPSLVATDDSPDEGFVGVIGGFGARKE